MTKEKRLTSIAEFLLGSANIFDGALVLWRLGVVVESIRLETGGFDDWLVLLEVEKPKSGDTTDIVRYIAKY